MWSSLQAQRRRKSQQNEHPVQGVPKKLKNKKKGKQTLTYKKIYSQIAEEERSTLKTNVRFAHLHDWTEKDFEDAFW